MSFHFNWIICLFIIGLWAFVIYSEYQSFAVICFANITTEDVACLFIYLINDVLCAALSVARIPLLSSCFFPSTKQTNGFAMISSILQMRSLRLREAIWLRVRGGDNNIDFGWCPVLHASLTWSHFISKQPFYGSRWLTKSYTAGKKWDPHLWQKRKISFDEQRCSVFKKSSFINPICRIMKNNKSLF